MTHINSLPDPLPHTPYLIPPSIPYIDLPAQLLGGHTLTPPLHLPYTLKQVQLSPFVQIIIISDPEPTDWTRIEVENQLKTYPESQILTVMGEG